MKTCVCCSQEKKETEFRQYKNRGVFLLRNQCRECERKRSKEYEIANKEKRLKEKRDFYANNLEKELKRKKEHYWKNRDNELARQAKFRAENREYLRERDRKIAKENPAYFTFKTQKRHTAKLQRTPSWLTEEQWKQIRTEYELSAWCSKVMGEKYNVDHIIPLQGKNVSGLHVPWNLRVIPAKDNFAKGNKYE